MFRVGPIPDPDAGAPVLVEARIDNMALGAKAKLFYRRAGAPAFSSVDFIREKGSKERFVATVPAFDVLVIVHLVPLLDQPACAPRPAVAA